MKVCSKYVVGFVLFFAWAVALYTSHVSMSTFILGGLVAYLGLLAFSYEKRRHDSSSRLELTTQFAEE